MPLAFLLLALLAAGTSTPASREPIVVKGHAWAPFISPMGEPFRARTADEDTLARWFTQADRNGDGILGSDEMRLDAERFFATLDTDHDGEIDPDELAQYEWEVAPDIQVMSRTRPAPGEKPRAKSMSGRKHEFDDEETGSRYPHGLQGGARYAVLNLPEPVAAADADFNRSITLQEFRLAAAHRLSLLRGSQASGLSLTQLQSLRLSLAKSKPKDEASDSRIGSPLPPGH
jgi:hypothetical protein